MSVGTQAWARKLLGVSPGATSDELKRAYRHAAKRCHPDAGGTDKAFQDLQKAYGLLSSSSASSGTVVPPADHQDPRDETPLEVGHWFTVRACQIDGRPLKNVRAQLVVIDMEILVGVYLPSPWIFSSSEILIYLSESQDDPDIAQYQRKIIQRSSDIKGHLTALWFSPFEQRMRTDGYVVGEQPIEVEPNPAFRREPRGWWF